MSTRFDAAVVGMGQAGPALAARLSKHGMTVAIIERGAFGGTCVNNGCTPTKAMVASAYAAQIARRARDYGVLLSGTPAVDMAAVKTRKDRLVLSSREGLEKWMQGLAHTRIYRGHARFTGPRTLQVADTAIAADRIFLDVGGRPRVPDLPGIGSIPYLTNLSVMDLATLPDHLIVIGGSYVGLEFAQMFRRFGSRVTVVEMGEHLLGREDPDVSECIAHILAAEGIALRRGAECISLHRDTDGLSVGLECSEGAPREQGSHVLLAVGRVPNTEDLGLKAAGIRTDGRGYIEVDGGLRTSNPHVWALGDCNGKGAFTHTAYNDYEIVADNLLENAGRQYTDRIPIYALFTDPPLGRVGMNEAQIREAGIEALVGKLDMTRVARAREKGETEGFLKIYAEKSSKRILGASLLGTGADEAVQSLLDAIHARMPYPQFQRHVRIHPTVSELLPTVLDDLKPLDSTGS
ncbi:MAG: FAD-containing oxidoreductase [Proteobacteria bacterium]|nr:FAD-containing oxidoreductase [Pseudomonadota bacterium]